MSGSLNRVTLIGNLGADPEIRTLNDGAKIASFSIATSERWKDRASGEVRERTEWHRVVIFAPGLVKLAEQYLQKGSKILVEGKLQTRKWQDQAGQDRYSTEIAVTPYGGLLTFLDRSRNDAGASGGEAPSRGASASRSAPGSDDLDQKFPSDPASGAGPRPGTEAASPGLGPVWPEPPSSVKAREFMLRQYYVQRARGGHNPLRVGVVPVGAIFYLQNDSWWRDRFRGPAVCRDPWIVEGFLNGTMGASRRNPDTGLWESTYRAGRSDMAVVRSLRDGRHRVIAVPTLQLHEEFGLVRQPTTYPSLPDLRFHRVSVSARGRAA